MWLLPLQDLNVKITIRQRRRQESPYLTLYHDTDRHMVKKAFLQIVDVSERLAHAYIKIGESCPRLDVSGMTVNKQHTTRNKQHTTHNTQQSTWLRT